VKAAAIICFMLGLVLPLLAERTYSPEYEPWARVGYQWLLKGTAGSVIRIIRHVVQGKPSFPAHHVSWICATVAFLCLPAALAIRGRDVLTSCLAGIGLLGVIWIFIKANPTLYLGNIGLGIVLWNASAMLTVGFNIRALVAKRAQRLAPPGV
jgi:hypothetical protein